MTLREKLAKVLREHFSAYHMCNCGAMVYGPDEFREHLLDELEKAVSA